MSPAPEEHRFELRIRASRGAEGVWDVLLAQGDQRWHFVSLLDFLVWFEEQWRTDPPTEHPDYP